MSTIQDDTHSMTAAERGDESVFTSKCICAICDGGTMMLPSLADSWGPSAWPVKEGMCCYECYDKVVAPANRSVNFLRDLLKPVMAGMGVRKLHLLPPSVQESLVAEVVKFPCIWKFPCSRLRGNGRELTKLTAQMSIL